MISAPITLPARLKRPPVSERAAERDGEDGVELDAAWPALLPSALLTFELIDQPGDAGAEAAEHVDADGDQPRAHAGHARRRRVDADRLDEQAERACA